MYKYIYISLNQLIILMLQWRLISKLQFNQVKTKLQSRHELVRVLRRRGLSEALHGEEQEQEEEEQEGLRGES